MRLTLIIATLSRGGAERVASILASSWSEQGKQVSLLTLGHGETPAYPLHPSVKLRNLGLLATSHNFLEAVWRNLHRIRVLRRAIRESHPDVVISFMDGTNVLTLLATRGMQLPVIVSEQTDPALHRIGLAWSTLRRVVYPLADALVCPVKASLARFQAAAKVWGCVIPNPFGMPPAQLEKATCDLPAGRVLMAMGRLVHQKGFDLLLQAFAQITDRHPEWSLCIMGEGPLRSDLQREIEALALKERAHLVGAAADPFPRLYSADLFVLSSRFEGFPLALCEAMACGLPVVSFDCPEGPAEIIRSGVDGVLVPPQDVDALAASLDRLMGDAQLRRKVAERAPEVRERFGIHKILAMWEELFSVVS